MILTSYAPAQLSDIEQIKLLMESVFGPFPRNEKLFTRWITQPQYNVVIAKVNKKIIGVST
jgi:hypothetical protein